MRPGGRPVDVPQVGDLRRDLPAKHVDGQRIPDADVVTGSKLGIERQERWSLVVLLPPQAGNDVGVLRRSSIGDTDIRVDGPHGIVLNRGVGHRHAIDGDHPTAHGRGGVERRDIVTGGHRVDERIDLIGLDVDHEEGRNLAGGGDVEFSRKIRLDTGDDRENGEPGSERHGYRNRPRPRTMEVGQRQTQGRETWSAGGSRQAGYSLANHSEQHKNGKDDATIDGRKERLVAGSDGNRHPRRQPGERLSACRAVASSCREARRHGTDWPERSPSCERAVATQRQA